MYNYYNICVPITLVFIGILFASGVSEPEVERLTS